MLKNQVFRWSVGVFYKQWGITYIPIRFIVPGKIPV